MSEKEHKGSFWERVSFTVDGKPVYPEEYVEGECPEEFHRDGHALAKVTVEYGRNINLGNYSSARISIGVELPAHVTELESAYVAASSFIGPKYVKLINSVIQKKTTGSTNK